MQHDLNYQEKFDDMYEATASKRLGKFHYRVQLDLIGTTFISVGESSDLFYIYYKSIIGCKEYKLYKCLVYTKEMAIQVTFDRYINDLSHVNKNDDEMIIEKLGKKLFGFFLGNSNDRSLGFTDNMNNKTNRQKFLTKKIHHIKVKVAANKQNFHFNKIRESIYGIESKIENLAFFNPIHDLSVSLINIDECMIKRAINCEIRHRIVDKKRKKAEMKDKLNMLIEFYVLENQFYNRVIFSSELTLKILEKYENSINKSLEYDLIKAFKSILDIHQDITLELSKIYSKSTILSEKVNELIEENIVKINSWVKEDVILDADDGNKELDENIYLVLQHFGSIDFSGYELLVNSFPLIKIFLENKTNLKSRIINQILDTLLQCIHKFTKYVLLLGNLHIVLDSDRLYNDTHRILIKISDLIHDLNSKQDIIEKRILTNRIKERLKKFPAYIFSDSRLYVDFYEEEDYTYFLFNDAFMITKRKGSDTPANLDGSAKYKFIDFIYLKDLSFLRDANNNICFYVCEDKIFKLSKFTQDPNIKNFLDKCSIQKISGKYLKTNKVSGFMNVHYYHDVVKNTDMTVVFYDDFIDDVVYDIKKTIFVKIDNNVKISFKSNDLIFELEYFYSNFESIIRSYANILYFEMDYSADEMFIVQRNLEFLNDANRIITNIDEINTISEISKLSKEVDLLIKSISQENLDLFIINEIEQFDPSTPDDLSLMLSKIAEIESFFRKSISLIFTFDDINIINSHISIIQNYDYFNMFEGYNLKYFIKLFRFLNNLIHDLNLNYLRKVFYSFFNLCNTEDVDNMLKILMNS